MNLGINYELTNERERGQVASYHHKPNPLKLNKTKHAYDVSGLKKADQRRLLSFEGGEYSTNYSIGFEIEKNQFHRSAVKEYRLLCGFERDGSCGYEAVTHILPLLPSSYWRTKVFDLFMEAEKIIDDTYSPSNASCGGHVTLSVKGLSGEQLKALVRKNSGIILSIFRHRLKNGYCGANRRMQPNTDTIFNSFGGSIHYSSTGNHYKYQLALVKGDLLEFRVPSRVTGVKQMMRRYELFYELVDFSVNNPNGSFVTFLNKVRPIIVSMYEGQLDKVEEIMSLAKSFQKFINTGKISDDIKKYL